LLANSWDPIGELGLKRDLLVGSNDAANGQEFHKDQNNFA
jgi:hypothetical protein